MGVRQYIARAASWVAKAAEGQYRPGPYYLPITGGWLSHDVGQYANWWQLGYNPTYGSGSAIVEACVSAYAQTIAMCPGDHWKLNSKGGRDRIITSALSRILRQPNEYQSISDFLLNLVRMLYLDGNAYALALRNDRYEVDELHLMESNLSRPMLAENGDVFYQLAGNQVIEKRIPETLMVPRRDVLHVRLHSSSRTYPWPLYGETPLLAANSDIMITDAMRQQQTQYYVNQARPSAVLSTDLVLDKNQTDFLRDRWNEQSRGLAAGGTPILTAGLKVQPWGTSAKDAELAEMMKLSEQHIALVYRIPLQILGLGGGAPMGSTEVLMQSWIASGLGFALNHLEEAFGLLFSLRGQPEEYVAFDTDALLRSAMQSRIEALVRGVQGGIYSPNEARAKEGLDEVKFGDEPRVQQQVVPLSAAGAIPSAPPANAPPSAQSQPAPTNKEEPPPSDQPGDKKEPPPKPVKKAEPSKDDAKRELRRLITVAGRAQRRVA